MTTMELQVAGKRLEVDALIAEQDAMHHRGQETHYFQVAASALECILAAQRSAAVAEPERILDLACGHGRVMRALRAAFPQASLTGCDVNHGGVDFCRDRYGSAALYAEPGVAGIQLSGTFDLIWCGSLFTHLPDQDWGQLLALCERHLSSSGVLVFSTHGEMVIRTIEHYQFNYGLGSQSAAAVVRDFRESGFGYRDYPEYRAYGVSAATIEWVVTTLHRSTTLQVCCVSEAAWDAHQDIYACCFRQARIERDLLVLAQRLAVELWSSEEVRARFAGAQPAGLADAIAPGVAAETSRRKLPFGPRLNHVLARLVAERLIRSPWGEGQS
jgi:SAM-dependent methyltransferase